MTKIVLVIFLIFFMLQTFVRSFQVGFYEQALENHISDFSKPEWHLIQRVMFSPAKEMIRAIFTIPTQKE